MLGFDITFVKKTLIDIGVIENNIKHSALQGVCWLVGVSILQFKLMKRSKSYKKKKFGSGQLKFGLGFDWGEGGKLEGVENLVRNRQKLTTSQSN